MAAHVHGEACAHGHGHDHLDVPPHHGAACDVAAPPAARGRDRDRRRLIAAIALTGVIFVAELVGGLWSGSLALLSDAGHMLTDVSAQAISLLALLLAARPADAKRSYGYRRLEVLAALANGVLLAVLAIVTMVSAARRFANPPSLHTEAMVAIAAVGLAANGVAAWLLHGSSSMNVRGAYLHILSDLLSSVAVVVGGLIMWWQHGMWILDPILGCLIGVLVLLGAWRLVKQAIDVLLEGVPEGVDIAKVRDDLKGVSGVIEVHDLHVWSIGSGLIALSAHVVARAEGAHHDELLHAIDRAMRQRHGIHHSTVQVESPGFAAVTD